MRVKTLARSRRASGRDAVLGAIVLAFLGTPNGVRATTIYVARRGWHVDVGFAAADLTPALDSLVARLPGAQYVFLGFGDRRYVLAAHHRGPVLLEALWPGAGVILATGLRATPTAAFGPDVVTLEISPGDAAAAQKAMEHAVTEDDTAPGPYGGSLYFDSPLSYSALHTCNTWAAEILAAAQLPVKSRGVVFAGQLWRRVQKISRQQKTATRPSSTG